MKPPFYYHIAGTLFTILVGTLLHFTYSWSHYNSFVGYFSAVNESTWEHLKLLVMPMFIFSIIEYLAYGKTVQSFWTAKLCSIVIGIFLIISLFYTYTGIFGRHILVVDIAIFIVSVILSYRLSYLVIKTGCNIPMGYQFLSFFGILIIVACFVIFTYDAPLIPLFQDPTKN